MFIFCELCWHNILCFTDTPLEMSHYTDGFSKDMCTAFNASDCKYSKLKDWCSKYPGILNDSEIQLVKLALKRARGSKSAYVHRRHIADKKKTVLQQIAQQKKKNIRLRAKLAKLQTIYDNLINTVVHDINLDKVKELKLIHQATQALNSIAEPTIIIGDTSIIPWGTVGMGLYPHASGTPDLLNSKPPIFSGEASQTGTKGSSGRELSVDGISNWDLSDCEFLYNPMFY